MRVRRHGGAATLAGLGKGRARAASGPPRPWQQAQRRPRGAGETSQSRATPDAPL